MTAIKATRTTITLGELDLEVFLLPDGSYIMSSSNIARILGMREFSLLGKYLSKELKAFLGMDSDSVVTWDKVGVTGVNYSVNAIPLPLAGLIFTHYAFKGNAVAQGIVVASAVEALERRADKAFGVLKSEEERNQWFAQRADSKLYRRKFTDKVADWNRANGHKPTNYGFATLWIYRHAGLIESYKAWKNLEGNKLDFRNTLSSDELKKVVQIEDLIANAMELKHLSFEDASDWYSEQFLTEANK